MRNLTTERMRDKQRQQYSDHRLKTRWCSCGCAVIEERTYGGRILGYRDAATRKRTTICTGCGDKLRVFELVDHEPKVMAWPCPHCSRPLLDLRDVEDARRYGGCNDCYREAA